MKAKCIFLILFVMGILGACSSPEDVEPIAVYPKDAPIAIYPYRPETALIYHATLDLDVSNVDRAAERAREIAAEQNGYLISSQSWYQDDEKYIALVLAVPAVYFEMTYDQLLRLGSVSGEWISSGPVKPPADSWDSYSQLTLYLRPQPGLFPDFTLPKWRPIRTFEKAWHVFVSIFGFLLDILIWLLVVLGPFILIGWGIYRFIQKLRQKP